MTPQRKQTVMTLVINAAILLVKGTVTEGKKWIGDTAKKFHAEMAAELGEWNKTPILQKYQKFYNELDGNRRVSAVDPTCYATITAGMSDILFELWREEKDLEITRRHGAALCDYIRLKLKLDKSQVTDGEMMMIAAEVLDPLAGVVGELIGQIMSGKIDPLKYKSVNPDNDDFLDQFKLG